MHFQSQSCIPLRVSTTTFNVLHRLQYNQRFFVAARTITTAETTTATTKKKKTKPKQEKQQQQQPQHIFDSIFESLHNEGNAGTGNCNNNDNSPRRRRFRVPRGFWQDEANRRQFFDRAAAHLGVRQLDDWYKVNTKQMSNIGAFILIKDHYGGSLINALSALYPEHEWQPWRFAHVAKRFWEDKANHKRFFDWVARHRGMRSLDDWYSVMREDIVKLGGAGLLQIHYGDSLQQALAAVYPEHEWLPWRFARVPVGFWNDPANHRRFFDWAARQLGIAQLPDDWYNVTQDAFNALGARAVLDRYNNSLIHALAAVYPEHEWLPWRFATVPAGFWQDKANHRRFFDWAAKQLGLTRFPDDWYGVSKEQMSKVCGSGLIARHYHGSLQQALAAVYPEHEWLSWKFIQVAKGFWEDKQNHRRFFDWAAKQLRVVRMPDDWYNVVNDDIHRLGGSGLLNNHYNGSILQALPAVYPEHEWLIWRFQQVPKGFWDDTANHRRYFDWAGRQLGIDPNSKNLPERWYAIGRDDVFALNGHFLLKEYYGSSLIRALAAVYPEHQWDPWRFQRCMLSRDELVDEPTLRRYVEGTLAVALQVETLDDWYRVSLRQAQECPGYATVVERHGGLLAVLKRLYKHHEWDEERMRQSRGKRSSQRQLKIFAQKLFPHEGIFEDYPHPELRFGETGYVVTLDVWIPSLSLALEYQGAQHYHDIHAMGTNAANQRGRDQEKRLLCSRAGITLVEVPYWWLMNHHRSNSSNVSRSSSSSPLADLAATISAARPDLLDQHEALAVAAAAGVPLTTPLPPPPPPPS